MIKICIQNVAINACHYLVGFNTETKAQNNIKVTIEKIVENGEDYVKVSIKNNNVKGVRVLSLAQWHGNEYTLFPISYLQMIGNPEKPNEKKTEKMVVTRKYNKKEPEKAPVSFLIDGNSTYTEKYKIFGEDIVCYKSLKELDKSIIKSLKITLVLKYIYLNDNKPYSLILNSNTINL